MVKVTGIHRKVDELGRVLLPLKIGELFSIVERDTLEILIDEEHQRILLKKVEEG